MAEDESLQDILEPLVVSPTQAEDNLARVERYHEALYSPQGAEALAYLKHERGYTDSTIKHFKLGFVGQPFPMDRFAQGYISIPFKTPAGYYGLRFRRGPGIPEDRPKYWSPAGSHTSLFNVEELDDRNHSVAVVEGEMDCMTAWQCGIPAVAYPGVKSIKQYHKHLFEGFQRVYIVGDGDEAGQGFNKQMAEMLRNGYPIDMPQGYDLSDYAKQYGAQKIRELIYGGKSA